MSQPFDSAYAMQGTPRPIEYIFGPTRGYFQYIKDVVNSKILLGSIVRYQTLVRRCEGVMADRFTIICDDLSTRGSKDAIPNDNNTVVADIWNL